MNEEAKQQSTPQSPQQGDQQGQFQIGQSSGMGGGPGMGTGNPNSMRVGFQQGKGGSIPQSELNKIFQQTRGQNGIYDVPDDLLRNIRDDYDHGMDLNAIYEFFERLAERITLTPPEDGNDEVSRLPIVYTQKRRIDRFGQVPMNEIDWESSMSMPNGEWAFFAKQSPITIDEEAMPMDGSTMDLCFIGDVSGSMGYVAPMVMYGADVDPATMGGHDAFCAMVHSIVKEIKEKEMGYHLRYSSILFSDSTQFSGWHSYYELDELLKFMYCGYQGGGTSFNAGVLQKMYQEATDKFLTIMLTDGAISNAHQSAQIVGQLIEQGNEFVLFEYGGGWYREGDEDQPLTEFGQYIKDKGAEVFPISSINDLFKITLGKAREMY